MRSSAGHSPGTSSLAQRQARCAVEDGPCATMRPRSAGFPYPRSRPMTYFRFRSRSGTKSPKPYWMPRKAQGLRSGENPARWRGHLDQLLPRRQRLTRGHHAAMAFADVPAFMSDLRAREAMAALALEFAILTASRSGEVLGCSVE